LFSIQIQITWLYVVGGVCPASVPQTPGDAADVVVGGAVVIVVAVVGGVVVVVDEHFRECECWQFGSASARVETNAPPTPRAKSARTRTAFLFMRPLLRKPL
jgi:hypothetical protein